jgi:hypothetical protein
MPTAAHRRDYGAMECLLAGIVLLPLCALILLARWVGIMARCAWEHTTRRVT